MALKTIVIAPHPDDEALGCGGALLRRKAEGAELCWLIVTGISEATGWTSKQVKQREAEIERVARLVGFDQVFNLGLPATGLDKLPMNELVGKLSAVFKEFEPEEVFLPHRADIHSDHRVVFDAAEACTKWFRYPSVRRVLSYETLSETEFCSARESAFCPNVYIDISNYLERKLEMAAIYVSEMGVFPFPRSVEAIRAQALLRGAASGFMAAEAFMLLRERQ